MSFHPKSKDFTLSYENNFSSKRGHVTNQSKFHEARFETLKESLKGIYKRLLDDEILKVMREDHSSSDFINERIEEIFNEVIDNDREELLNKFAEKYQVLKNQYEDLLIEKEKLEKSQQNIHTASLNQIQSLEKELFLLNESNRVLTQENEKLHRQFNDFSSECSNILQRKEEDLSIQNRDLSMENAKLQAKLKEFDFTIKNLMQEKTTNSDLIQKYSYDYENGRKKIIMLEKEMEQLRENLNEKYTENDFHVRNTQDLESLQLNYQDKNEKLADENKIFFNQIDELKTRNVQLEKEKRLIAEEITNKFQEEMINYEEMMKRMSLKKKKYKKIIYEKNEEKRNFSALMENKLQESAIMFNEEKAKLLQEIAFLKNNTKEEKDNYEKTISELNLKHKEKINELQMQTHLKIIDIQVNQDETQKKKFFEERIALETENSRLKEENKKLIISIEEEKRKIKIFESINEDLISPKKTFLLKSPEMDYYKRIKELESQHQREIISNQAMYEEELKSLKFLIDSTTSEKSSLKKEFDQLNINTIKSREEKAFLEKTHQKLLKDYEELQAESNKSVQNREVIAKKLQKAEIEINDLNFKLNQKNKLNNELNSKSEHIEAEVNIKIEQINKLKLKVSELSQKQIQSDSEFNKIKSGYEEKITDLDRKEKENTEKYSKIQLINSDLDHQMSFLRKEAQDKIENLTKILHSRDSTIMSLEQTLENKKIYDDEQIEKIEELKKKVSDREKQLATLENKIVTLQNEKKTLVIQTQKVFKKLKASKQRLISNVSDTLSKYKNLLNKLRESLTKQMEIVLKEFFKNIAAIPEKMLILRNRIIEKNDLIAQNKISLLKKEFEDVLFQKGQEFQREKENLQNQFIEENNKFKLIFEEQEKSKKEVELEKKGLHKNLTAKEQEIIDLNRKLDNITHEKDLLKEKISSVASHNEKLEKEKLGLNQKSNNYLKKLYSCIQEFKLLQKDIESLKFANKQNLQISLQKIIKIQNINTQDILEIKENYEELIKNERTNFEQEITFLSEKVKFLESEKEDIEFDSKTLQTNYEENIFQLQYETDRNQKTTKVKESEIEKLKENIRFLENNLQQTKQSALELQKAKEEKEKMNLDLSSKIHHYRKKEEKFERNSVQVYNDDWKSLSQRKKTPRKSAVTFTHTPDKPERGTFEQTLQELKNLNAAFDDVGKRKESKNNINKGKEIKDFDRSQEGSPRGRMKTGKTHSNNGRTYR